MRYDIDIKASLKKERLVIRESWFEKFIEIQVIAIICSTLAIAPALLIYKVHENSTSPNDFHLAYLVALVTYSLLAYTLYKLFGLFRFKKLTGKNPSFNRKIVKEFARLQELTVMKDNKECFIGVSKISPFTWGSQITILFKKEVILFNSITYGRYGFKSPYSFGNHSTLIHHLKSLIQEKQEEHG